ncbi:hypothetical protein EDB89DRAFT_1909477 [Lactarius sanguifluus]|nr:hypothetical protein EDB89DRAFT_1909477 [Lactarius sanguifluus]
MACQLVNLPTCGGCTRHSYYQPGAEFPQDISDILPSEDHWWEILAAKSLKAAACHNATKCSIPKVTLLLPDPPANYVAMESHRATHNQKKSKKAAEAAAGSRKHKCALPPGGKTKKRHVGSSQLQPAPAHQDDDEYQSEDEEEVEEDDEEDGEYEDEIEIEDEDEGEDELKDEDKDEIKDKDKEKDELEGEDDVDKDEDKDEEDEIEEHKQYKFELKEPENSVTDASVPGQTAT